MLPRILVADDDPTTVLLITAALREGFEVVVVSTGDEVLSRAEAGDIDLVLLDVMMPGLDGFEVCRRLQAHPRGAGIPVIFVTALDDSADEARGFAVGAVDYITKPIRPAIVRARVHTHVELKRARDVLQQLALVDPLTGIANRRGFDAALSREWRRSRGSRWVSLALVDADHFKQFNDGYGHLAGDERLRAIASALGLRARRAGELAARYGGDEFALILPDIDPRTMQELMKTLLKGVAAVRLGDAIPGAHEVITVSVGAISVVPLRDTSELPALALVDTLLYEAKAGGRDCCVHQDLVADHKVVIHRLVE